MEYLNVLSVSAKSVSTTPPTLVSPADGDTNVTVNTTFTWTGEADVLWLDLNPSFANHSTFSVTGTSYTVTSPLNPNTIYYWKAGKTVGSTTYWSQYNFHFTTGP